MSKVLKNRTTRKTESDGSITEEEVRYAVKTESTPFLMLFIPYEKFFAKMNSAMDFKILFLLAERAEFNTGKVSLTSNERKILVDSLGITGQTLTNSIYRLRSGGVISGTTGEYFLNPQYIWKGTTNSRNRALKEISSKLYDRPLEPSGHQEESGPDKEDLRRQRLGQESPQGIPNQIEIFKEGIEEI